ncbi:membrane hypothetical protein [Gammaproteobacteria bacterium]
MSSKLNMSLILLGVGIFYLVLWATGTSIETASLQGWLAGTIRNESANEAGLSQQVDWETILQAWPAIIPLGVAVILTTLVNATGLDIASQEDGDFDRELKGIGIAIIISGFAGGILGHTSASRSLLHRQAGAQMRFGGIWAAILCFLALHGGSSLVLLFPRVVLSGMLLSIGLAILREWLIHSYWKLPFREFLLIPLVMVIIVVKGPIVGVGIGVFITALLFVFNYSQVECTRRRYSSGDHHSNKDRPVQQMSVLRHLGNNGTVIELQGFLFFGTAVTLIDLIRAAVEEEHVRFVVLDFRNVFGIDASTSFSFVKLTRIASRNQSRLVLSGLRPHIKDFLRQVGLYEGKDLHIETDLDRALEWVEDRLLESWRERYHEESRSLIEESRGALGSETTPKDSAFGTNGFFQTPVDKAVGDGQPPAEEMSIREIFAPFQMPPEKLDILLQCCKIIEIEEGTSLFHRGDPADGMYLIERGTLSVIIRMSDEKTKRLRTLGPGSVVGEMSIYSRQPRSAEVQAETACRVWKLGCADFERLGREHPEVANEFHTFIVKLLSYRLTAANVQILALS